MRIHLGDPHPGHSVGAQLVRHFAGNDLHGDRQPRFAGFQPGVVLVANPDLDDGEKPFGAPRKFDGDRARGLGIFRQLPGHPDQVGDSEDRLTGDGCNHIVRL